MKLYFIIIRFSNISIHIKKKKKIVTDKPVILSEIVEITMGYQKY